MISIRVLDAKGIVQWHGLIPNKLTRLKTSVGTEILDSVLERELTEEDGGPLLIYRLVKESK